MIVFTKISPLQKQLSYFRDLGLSTGFVPTMGALHSGHMTLIDSSNDKNDITVCSIFVNPTQFNESSDLDNYPITTQADLDQLLRQDCNVVFLPAVDEIYPDDKSYEMPYDLGSIANVLEGANRPGHFEGVIQVIDRLLDIVQPDQLFMGQKDYQQFSIIQRMLEIKKSKTTLEVCPIVRETGGLAMSSRNVRLTKEDRKSALKLSAALYLIKAKFNIDAPAELLDECYKLLNDKNIILEYLEIVDGLTLGNLNQDTKQAVALIAAKVGKVRLLDNVILN